MVGVLLNDPAELQAIGDAACAPPYRAPPRAPVLYVKPRNTFAANGTCTRLPENTRHLCIGASIGLVIGRATCRVSAQSAAANAGYIAGYTLVVDLFVPHASVYRPSVRERAFDQSCVIGPEVVSRDALDPDDATIDISVDGGPARSIGTRGLVRSAARLLADVSEFMTLHAGDVLLLGVRHDPPLAEAGQSWSARCAGIGTLNGKIGPTAASATGSSGGPR